MRATKVFDQGMWDAFAGCERFPTGEQPVYREFPNGWLVICDGQGLVAYEEGDLDREHVLEVRFPTQAAALVFLDGLPEEFDPPQYGFVVPKR
jgi:hypothetical protein